MNFANVFFFGQYGQSDRMKACAEDANGVWRNFSGSFIPEPKLIDGVLVCAPGDLIERLGSIAVAARIEAVRNGREPSQDRGGDPASSPLPRLPAAAEDAAEAEGQDNVRYGRDGARAKPWVKQWGSKRWHLRRSNDPAKGVCGKRLVATKEAESPPWNVACMGCLIVIQRGKNNA